jgi:SpoIID/LytB domain protein
MRILLVALVLLAGAAHRPEASGARDLPPPLPPPREPAPQVQADPLDLVWGHRLHFAPGGVPLVTIRLAERRSEVRFQVLADTRLLPRGGSPVLVPRGAWLRARAFEAQPAVLAQMVLLAELDHADRAGIDVSRELWTSRGLEVAERVIGGVYGIAGKVVDNRRTLLLAGGALSAADASALADRIQAEHGARPAVYASLVAPPSGRVEVTTDAGVALASGDALVSIEGGGFMLEDGAGAKPRRYRGRLVVTLDSAGQLAAVDALPLEELLRGLVPSEIPASSPREALQAQAVTARSYVLAQIGTRHLADPYALCSEVHCQAYHGEGAETPSTDAAVRATAGQALFDREGLLVDGVYSAMCGGHGEDNDAVWRNLPSESLRGRPDLPADAARGWRSGLASEARLAAFLDDDGPTAWCAAGPKKRYRWSRSFTRAEVDAIGEGLGAGRVNRIAVLKRGVSGRALAVEVVGDTGRVVLEGELRIRRAFRNLESAMFLVARSAEGWVFRGGGWGHGVGMCQWGAVGRARAGQGYEEILRAYFGGAEIAKIY